MARGRLVERHTWCAAQQVMRCPVDARPHKRSMHRRRCSRRGARKLLWVSGSLRHGGKARPTRMRADWSQLQLRCLQLRCSSYCYTFCTAAFGDPAQRCQVAEHPVCSTFLQHRACRYHRCSTGFAATAAAALALPLLPLQRWLCRYCHYSYSTGFAVAALGAPLQEAQLYEERCQVGRIKQEDAGSHGRHQQLGRVVLAPAPQHLRRSGGGARARFNTLNRKPATALRRCGPAAHACIHAEDRAKPLDRKPRNAAPRHASIPAKPTAWGSATRGPASRCGLNRRC
jgi:hypothetical protein